MASQRPSSCRVCGKDKEEVGAISWRGKCATCGKANLNENNDAMVSKSGPAYLHWARRSFMKARVKVLAAERDAA